MKPFFGIDRTEDKKNLAHNSDCFAAATVSGAIDSALTRAAETSWKQVERAKLPKPLRAIQMVAGFTALLILGGIIRALRNVDIAQAFENAPGLFWAMGICAAIWLVLTAIGAAVRSKVTAQEDYALADQRLGTAMEAAYLELGVPQDCKEVDVISITHRWKNGKLKVHTRGTEMSAYTNCAFKVFVREGRLCFADLRHRYEVELDSLRCLRSVKKPIAAVGWNKDEGPTQGFYKPYKLAVDQYKRIHMKRYGLLEFSRNGEDWAIWLPPYELNYISALTGLEITE